MVQHHKYSITEIEDLIPYERDIFIEMLMAFLEREREELENKKRR